MNLRPQNVRLYRNGGSMLFPVSCEAAKRKDGWMSKGEWDSLSQDERQYIAEVALAKAAGKKPPREPIEVTKARKAAAAAAAAAEKALDAKGTSDDSGSEDDKSDGDSK